MDASTIDLTGLPNPATVDQLGRWLGGGTHGVREAIRRRELEAVRVNRRGDLRVFHGGVRRYLQNRLTTAEAK